MNLRRTVATLSTIVVLTACSAGSGAPTATTPAATAVTPPSASAASSTDGAALTLYAAASLKGVLAEVKTAYELAVPGTTLTIATGSSSTLRTQIEEGAPADVFLSADQKNPQTLVDAGLVDGAVVDFAGNLLTVIVPADNPAGITTPADLARSGVKIVAAGDEVPITKYAQEAIANLASQPGYPAAFAEAYAASVVSKEENVKAAVAKIELGEGDAAIVYVTDAKVASNVKTIEIPDAANVPATYAGVVVKASTHASEAHAFIDWLAGPDGAAILATFGFLPPS